MALQSRFGYRSPIPSVTTRKGQTKVLSFVDGVNSHKDNDDVKPTELREAYDARFGKIGRYRTRQGLNRYSVPIGEAVQASETSTAGASTLVVDGTHAVGQKLTAGAAGALTSAEVRIRTTGTSAGTLLVEIYSDSGGVPDSLLGRSSLLPADITGSFAYKACYFVKAPAITNGQVIWVVVRGQDANVGAYEVSTTTNTTNAKTQDSTLVWTARSYSVNAKISLSTDGGVKGVYRAYRSNGLKTSMFAHASSLYSVNDVTGATTSLISGLNSVATDYRFAMAQDSVYIVNGYEKPYKYDLAAGTVASVTTAPNNASLVIEHKGIVFYGDATDRSKIFYTNFGLYDTFTSTDFLYVMAPKSPDAHTAFAKLNGVMYVFARRNKFILFGDSNATFSLDEAPSQRGTFSQESVVYDANFIFHADEDGVWQFDGTSEVNLAEPFLDEYQALLNKENIRLELYGNRLYVFHTVAGQSLNTECYVINIQLRKYESKDLGTYVGRTFARLSQEDTFIQASNRVGALYYGEATSNAYDNLGDQLQFEIATAFNHFDTPAQLKRAPKWRPVFDSSTNIYSIQSGYALDNSLDVTWTDISLAGNQPRFDTGLLFDTGVTFANDSSIEPTTLFVNGTFKRLQRRYRHIAAHEPVEIDSEVLTVEAQRVI